MSASRVRPAPGDAVDDEPHVGPRVTGEGPSLEKRLQNLEALVLGLLQAFEPDGRLNPIWLVQVKSLINIEQQSGDEEEG